MKTAIKVIPLLLACILAAVIFYFAGGDPPKISQQDLKALRVAHKQGEVGRVDNNNNLLQYEEYGKPAKHQYRVQVPVEGTAVFYNNEGHQVLKVFLDAGDQLITVPPHETIDAYWFLPFQWIE